MAGLGIDWSSFGWDAFATLATGFAAVVAANFVGSRQVKITERQTDILDRQIMKPCWFPRRGS